MLLEATCDVNLQDARGVSPLFAAAKATDIGLVSTLLDARANVDAYTKDGQSALTVAQGR